MQLETVSGPFGGARLAMRKAAVVLMLFLFPLAAAAAVSKSELDAQVRAAVTSLEERHADAAALMSKAYGMLVFPQVLKAGFLLGGATGEGALLVDGEPVEYYRAHSLSVGLQAGGQTRSEAILFMTEEALEQFRQSNGWKAGVDGDIAVAELGASGGLDSNNLRSPIIGFMYGNRGLMLGLSFKGAKYSRIEKD